MNKMSLTFDSLPKKTVVAVPDRGRAGDAGFLASTMWHAVEFSRIERAQLRLLNRRQGNPTNLVFPLPPVKPPRRRFAGLAGPPSYPRRAQAAPTGLFSRGAVLRGLAVAFFSPPSSAPVQAARDNLRGSWGRVKSPENPGVSGPPRASRPRGARVSRRFGPARRSSCPGARRPSRPRSRTRASARAPDQPPRHC